MVDVKIGLAARFFGQFGEGYKNAAIPEVLQDKFCPRQFGRRRQYVSDLAYMGSLSVVAP